MIVIYDVSRYSVEANAEVQRTILSISVSHLKASLMNYVTGVKYHFFSQIWRRRRFYYIHIERYEEKIQTNSLFI